MRDGTMEDFVLVYFKFQALFVLNLDEMKILFSLCMITLVKIPRHTHVSVNVLDTFVILKNISDFLKNK